MGERNKQIGRGIIDTSKVRVLAGHDERGQARICIPIDGLHLSIPVKLHDQPSPGTPLIASELNVSRSTKQQQEIGMSFGEFMMDYDEVAEIYQNRQYTGGRSKKSYLINRWGIFTPMSDLKQIVFCFPFINIEDINSWNPLPDSRTWPVFVTPPPRTFYPSDFGRGTAIRWKRSRHNGDIYLVVKTPLDQAQFDIENPKYYGKMFQVPSFMIRFRPVGVDAIDRSDNSITFLRRGMNPLITTVNEIRSMSPADPTYIQRMAAIFDIINDYPVQLRDLLTPGELEASRAYQLQMNSQSQDDQSASAAAAANSNGTPYTPAYDLQQPQQIMAAIATPPPSQQQQQQPNPFAQHAYKQLGISAPITNSSGHYPMSYNVPSGKIDRVAE